MEKMSSVVVFNDDHEDPDLVSPPRTSSLPSGNIVGKVVPSPARSSPWRTEQGLTLLEANVDDCTPEHLAFCLELLLAHGAADAWITPIVMKKSRAAHTLHCLCPTTTTSSLSSSSPSSDRLVEELMEIIFRHSTTLGIRVRREVERVCLDRHVVTVSDPAWARAGDDTGAPTIRVKLGYSRDGGATLYSAKAEYEDCRALVLAQQQQAYDRRVGDTTHGSTTPLLSIQQIADRAVQLALHEHTSTRTTTTPP